MIDIDGLDMTDPQAVEGALRQYEVENARLREIERKYDESRIPKLETMVGAWIERYTVAEDSRLALLKRIADLEKGATTMRAVRLGDVGSPAINLDAVVGWTPWKSESDHGLYVRLSNGGFSVSGQLADKLEFMLNSELHDPDRWAELTGIVKEL